MQCTAVGATSQPCPEGEINPNADNMTQVSQAQGQLWAALPTEVNQTFGTTAEIHNGAAYWVIDTGSFDKTGRVHHDQPGVRLGGPRGPEVARRRR